MAGPREEEEAEEEEEEVTRLHIEAELAARMSPSHWRAIGREAEFVDQASPRGPVREGSGHLKEDRYARRRDAVGVEPGKRGPVASTERPPPHVWRVGQVLHELDAPAEEPLGGKHTVVAAERHRDPIPRPLARKGDV